MKKLVLGLALIFILVSSQAFAQHRESTDGLTSDTLVYTARSGENLGFCGIVVAANGTDAATATVYDATSATGKKFTTITVAAGETLGGAMYPSCVKAKTGLFLDVGTNTTAWVIWTR